MTLLFDNYDSFTYNLRDYLAQLGQPTIVVRNDALSLENIEALSFDNILLSPGPKRPADAGLMLPLIARYEREKPILGICLGHQAIAEFYGGKLVNAARPMHGKTSLIHHTQHPLFQNVASPFVAMRYHSLVIEQLPSQLESLAKSANGELMAFAHRDKKIAGMQFHPESILTKDGLQLLRNWFAWVA